MEQVRIYKGDKPGSVIAAFTRCHLIYPIEYTTRNINKVITDVITKFFDGDYSVVTFEIE